MELTRAQVREFDRLAIESLGLPGVVLMENAGRAVALAALDMLGQANVPLHQARVAVLCGSGNNGGDGYVAVRHLAVQDVHARAYPLQPVQALTGDARLHAHVAQQLGLVRSLAIDELERELASLKPHLAIDALLGTGFKGSNVRPPLDAAVTLLSALRLRGSKVLAVDLPSGLDCDTGVPANPCVTADVTLTLVARKVGFRHPQAQAHLGKVIVADIGVPIAENRP